MIVHSITITFDAPFWIVLFEIYDKEGYSVARKIIGTSEPIGSDILMFFDNLDYSKLEYTNPLMGKMADKCRLGSSYKKRQKKIKKEMDIYDFKNTFTKAQRELKKQFMKIKIEQKMEKKNLNKKENERKFQLKQSKRHEKHKGH